jgi:hypothetical protein
MAKADPEIGTLVTVTTAAGETIAGRFQGRETLADARRYVIEAGGRTTYVAVEAVETLEEV